MSVKIKICGLTRMEDIDVLNRFHPDYAGFVFAKKSRRYLPPEKAAALRKALDPSIPAVGVFVNPSEEEIMNLVRAGTIQLIQLHGQEPEETISRLREKSGLPVIRAFPVAGETDIRKANASTADYVLLDNGAGGSGERFDWNLLCGMDRPYFLAGGLTPENVANALLSAQKPMAVDVSSGVETGGVKDPEKICTFIEKVRGF